MFILVCVCVWNDPTLHGGSSKYLWPVLASASQTFVSSICTSWTRPMMTEDSQSDRSNIGEPAIGLITVSFVKHFNSLILSIDCRGLKNLNPNQYLTA